MIARATLTLIWYGSMMEQEITLTQVCLRCSVKIGDLVKLCEIGYPQYVGLLGILVRCGSSPAPSTPWVVMINGKLHTFYINEDDMEAINESR